jgi:hypothetical protein
MKRVSVILLSAVLLFFSCDTKYYAVVVENGSSKAVTYTYNNSVTTIAPGESAAYRVEAYTLPPEDIAVDGAMSVAMESLLSGERYVFSDIDFLTLQVENTLGMEVKLRASKYINDDHIYEYIETDSGGTVLPVPAANDAGTTQVQAKIYTINPHFTVEAYSPEITWVIEGDIAKGFIMKALIK